MRIDVERKEMKPTQHDRAQTTDLDRARRALVRLYERAIQLALEAEQAEREQKEAAERLVGRPAAESTGERDERNSQGS